MREIIYYSNSAPTSGSYIKEDLQKSGRLDIALHTIIAAFFLSHKMREDVKLHLCFAGPPTPPRHLELKPVTQGKTGEDKIYLNKSNVAQIIKKMLYKHKPNQKNQIFPGYWIEKKSFLQVISDLEKENKSLYLLDKKGKDIRTVPIQKNPVFILGDHKGLPQKELKRLKKLCTRVSIGKRTYFASQTVTIINNELDRREDKGKL